MNPQLVLQALAQHVGKNNGIRACDLANQLMIPERRLRVFISELRETGTAVCGHPKNGYYIARTAQELEDACDFIRSRAIHSLRLESKMRGIPLEDLVGQLHLKT